MNTLALGKYRRLQQCSTANHALSILALDHRGNLRQALNPSAPDSVTPVELTRFKLDVIGALAPAASAALLDPQYGAAQCIAQGALPGDVGLVLAVEASGYTGNPDARESRILPGWSIAKSGRLGVSAVKLLVYYHPDAPTATLIENLVRQVGVECAEHEVPLLLEPLSYSPDASRRKLSPAERYDVVLETARRLTPLGADVLKAEFPLDVSAEPDEDRWFAACQALSQASTTPWVLLSASVDFETFVRQVDAACRAGASGVAVGRAVWREATDLTGDARVSFLTHTAYERMTRMTAMVDALANPWTDFYAPPAVDDQWYAGY